MVLNASCGFPRVPTSGDAARTSACATVLSVAVLFVAGCGASGKVNQGRVIEYNATQGVATLISDSNPSNPADPHYDVLPPVTIHIPDDPRQMGPVPEAGKLLRLDTKKCEAVVFDAATRSIHTITYTVLEERNDVFADDPRIAGRVFPVVDREGKTITVYSSEMRWLATFTVPERYLVLPDETWKRGDDIRYYYKDPGKALRLMNVTKAGAL